MSDALLALIEADAARLRRVLADYEAGRLGVQRPRPADKRPPLETYFGKATATIAAGGTGLAEVWDVSGNDHNFTVTAFNGCQTSITSGTPLSLRRDPFTGVYAALPLQGQWAGNVCRDNNGKIWVQNGSGACAAGTGCCGSGSGSGSGSGGPPQTFSFPCFCNGVITGPLYLHFTTGPTCLTGLTPVINIPNVFNPSFEAEFDVQQGPAINPCQGAPTGGAGVFILECGGLFPTLQLFDWNGGGYTFNATKSTCSPFSVEFDNVPTSIFGCTGGGTCTIVIDTNGFTGNVPCGCCPSGAPSTLFATFGGALSPLGTAMLPWNELQLCWGDSTGAQFPCPTATSVCCRGTSACVSLFCCSAGCSSSVGFQMTVNVNCVFCNFFYNATPVSATCSPFSLGLSLLGSNTAGCPPCDNQTATVVVTG